MRSTAARVHAGGAIGYQLNMVATDVIWRSCARCRRLKRQSLRWAYSTGKKEASIANMMTPSDHMSAAKASYGSEANVSGAAYDKDAVEP